jgi:hypothetical protein
VNKIDLIKGRIVMDKKKKEKLFIGTTFSVLLAIVLLVFRLLNYIDSSVILIVYFPYG